MIPQDSRPCRVERIYRHAISAIHTNTRVRSMVVAQVSLEDVKEDILHITDNALA